MANRKAGPRPNDLLTRVDLADALNVHPMTITKWERQGMPIQERGRRGKPSMYSESAVRSWRAERDEAARNGGILDAVQERARKDRAQSLLAEQTLAIRARDLVPKDEVERAWSAEVAAVRTKLLAWPSTLSNRVFRAGTLDGLEGVERELQSAVEEALNELSAMELPDTTKRSRALESDSDERQKPKRVRKAK